METKTCTQCGREFPATLEYFRRSNSRGKIGLRAECKMCARFIDKVRRKANPELHRERCRQWREAHPERQKTANRNWYQKNIDEARRRARESMREERMRNPERWREYMKTYRMDNAAKIAERAKVYRCKSSEKVRRLKEGQVRRYQTDPEYRAHVREVTQQWRLNNPDKRARQAKASSQNRRARRRATGHLTTADIRRQYDRQRGHCYWCRGALDEKYHVDHVIPLSRGGANDPSNIVIACAPCNLSKGAKLPEEWAGRLL